MSKAASSRLENFTHHCTGRQARLGLGRGEGGGGGQHGNEDGHHLHHDLSTMSVRSARCLGERNLLLLCSAASESAAEMLLLLLTAYTSWATAAELCCLQDAQDTLPTTHYPKQGRQ